MLPANKPWRWTSSCFECEAAQPSETRGWGWRLSCWEPLHYLRLHWIKLPNTGFIIELPSFSYKVQLSYISAISYSLTLYPLVTTCAQFRKLNMILSQPTYHRLFRAPIRPDAAPLLWPQHWCHKNIYTKSFIHTYHGQPVSNTTLHT